MKNKHDQRVSRPHPDHLLKEYELCFKDVHDHNSRLWNSASIFIPGSVIALTWVATQIQHSTGWFDFAIQLIISLVVVVVLWSHLRIFKSWELLDRIAFFRAEEIEERLKLLRIVYRNYLHERTNDEKDHYSAQTNLALSNLERALTNRLGYDIEGLTKRKHRANSAFRTIERTIIGAAFVLVVLSAVNSSSPMREIEASKVQAMAREYLLDVDSSFAAAAILREMTVSENEQHYYNLSFRSSNDSVALTIDARQMRILKYAR